MSRKPALVLLLWCLGCIAPASAQQPAGDDMVHAFLLGADSDGNGLVTREEAAAYVERTRKSKAEESARAWGDLVAFVGVPAGSAEIPGDAYADALARTVKAADADGDGAVTSKEMKAYVDGLPEGPVRRIVAEVTGALDADGDGNLSATEVAGGLAAVRSGGTMSLKVVTEAAQRQADMERLLFGMMAKENGDAEGRIVVAHFARPGATGPARKD